MSLQKDSMRELGSGVNICIRIIMDWMLCVPKFLCCNPHPQYDVSGSGPLGSNHALIRRGRDTQLPLSGTRTWRKGTVCKPGEKPETRPCLHLDLGLPACRTGRKKCLLFEPLSMWYSAVARSRMFKKLNVKGNYVTCHGGGWKRRGSASGNILREQCYMMHRKHLLSTCSVRTTVLLHFYLMSSL